MFNMVRAVVIPVSSSLEVDKLPCQEDLLLSCVTQGSTDQDEESLLRLYKPVPGYQRLGPWWRTG